MLIIAANEPNQSVDRHRAGALKRQGRQVLALIRGTLRRLEDSSGTDWRSNLAIPRQLILLRPGACGTELRDNCRSVVQRTDEA